jgi:hypothetical protein
MQHMHVRGCILQSPRSHEARMLETPFRHPLLRTFRVASVALSFASRHSGTSDNGTLYLSETHAALGLLPATPFAATLGAELADPRRQMLGIPPAAHAVPHGAGGMLYLKFTLQRYQGA